MSKHLTEAEIAAWREWYAQPGPNLGQGSIDFEARVVAERQVRELRDVLRGIDWLQVALNLNSGLPCFYRDNDGTYCCRSERWAGHGSHHEYVPLAAILKESNDE